MSKTEKWPSFSEFLKKSNLGKYRFPLFTGWFWYLLNYKLAYEFLKKKGLFKEFQIWSEDEGRKLAKTFFKEALQMIEEQEQKNMHEEINSMTEEEIRERLNV